jgi:hypothetical protein
MEWRTQRPADRQEEEQPMNGKKAFGVLLAVAAASSFLGTASAVANDMGDGGHGGDGGGNVVPCSLAGINPAHHPEIFGNPATAASYGFVRARDGTWHVRPGCRS